MNIEVLHTAYVIESIVYLLLWEGAYLCDNMNDWENFNETSTPEKEDFYTHLNMKGITNADYVHSKKKLSRSWKKNV